jgi:hypothetical protein
MPELQAPCLACAAQFHGECYEKPAEADCCCSTVAPASRVDIPDGGTGEVREYKDASNSIDPKSTGRKRAARMYPIHNGMECEWRGLANAGGNKSIVGCHNGIALHRHHGPNKDTLHNELGNVHRICTTCHNRWHARNDPDYDWNGPWTPHDPVTKATDEQMVESELYWVRNKPKKASKE